MLKSIKNFLLLHVLPPLVFLLIMFIGKSSKIIHIGKEEIEDLRKDTNLIFCFWHGRLLMMPFAYRGGRGKVIVSRHRDGEFIARVIKYFNLINHFRVGFIRGSHGKGGISTSREILKTLKEGLDVAVTPDGPRGPRYVVKKGILEIARLSGKPLIPVTYSASKKKLSIPGISFFYLFLSQRFSLSGVSL